ncbi:MAG: chorismate-binding protein, partial [Methylotenera sp.]
IKAMIDDGIQAADIMDIRTEDPNDDGFTRIPFSGKVNWVKLKPGMDAIDVLKATFPAGTVSGAPKVRAMEIIDELEPSKRGIYAGAVGYLGFNGDMDVAIAIRTGVIKNNMLHVQAGAGIVADSIPHSEWVETQNKARAVLRAAELVQDGLDVNS